MTRPRATSAATAATGPSALTLLEDAVHLLRRAPAAAWLFHFLGAGLWTLALLFAWASVSWFRPARDDLAAGALMLVALYAWMKTAQAEFCARLMSQLLGAPPEKFTLRRAARLASTQFAPHAFGPAILVIAGVLVIPFSRAWLYFQTTTALAADAVANNNYYVTENRAMPLAKLWPRQGLLGLLIITALALLVFINIAVSFYLIPSLARTLFGVENFTSVSGWTPLNTTFLMSVTALTWFAIDPLAKAFCVLRVFHGRARRTGADLLIEMERARPSRATRPSHPSHSHSSHLSHSATLLIALVLFAAAAPNLTGASSSPTISPTSEPNAPATLPGAAAPTVNRKPETVNHGGSATAVSPADLNRAIDETLSRAEFRWQMPPAKTQSSDDSNFITRLFAWFYGVLKSIAHAVDNFITWLLDLFSRKTPDALPAPATATANAAPLLKLFLYALVAVLAALLIWVFYTAWRKTDPAALAARAARPATDADTATPDLADESAHAAQLPADGWLRLAREQAALGEWRLALRALYLAHLARLDTEGLLTLKRHKTNLDYERELRRRALQRAALADWFSARRREFEETWYGRARSGEQQEQQVRHWFAEVEKGAPEAIAP